ncbi:MAG: 30S ribosomal protein S2 [Bacilli bacterium]|nr:30S ribosomal protein S2 [Bacilli bacterium]
MSEEKEIEAVEAVAEEAKEDVEEKKVEEVSEMASVIHDPNDPIVTVKQLLEVGAHFGHLKRRWNAAFKPYIYAVRTGIHIINLDKTAEKIASDYAQLRDIVSKGGKVLFVGTKRSASQVIAEEAVRSGSFYVNNRWLGGTLTNFKTISQRLKLLKSLEQLEIDGVYDTMPKKIAIEKKKTQTKLASNLAGIKEMRKLPDALIVVDPKTEHNAVAEAKILNIPVFALLGSNCNPTEVSNPIPCNDDSYRTVKLIVGLLADAIVEGKGGDVAYAYTKQEGEALDFDKAIKTTDRNEEYKLIKLRIREDQYAIRAAKKGKRKHAPVKKFVKKYTKKPEAKKSDTTETKAADTKPATVSEASTEAAKEEK